MSDTNKLCVGEISEILNNLTLTDDREFNLFHIRSILTAAFNSRSLWLEEQVDYIPIAEDIIHEDGTAHPTVSFHQYKDLPNVTIRNHGDYIAVLYEELGELNYVIYKVTNNE